WGVEVGTPVARAVHRTDPAGLPSAEAVTEALIAAFGAHRRAAAALGGAAPSGAAPDGGAGQPEIWHVLEASPSLGLLEALAQPAGGGEG
ncbi:MAG: hypothetical protein MI919_29245, partial [Holophagales bacterium]|nr:hypothetical protein [Holophagales bacterium]